MKNKKRIILIGGLGNVLYQLNAISDIEDISIDVGLLGSRLIHRILGWTFHDTLSALDVKRENIVDHSVPKILCDVMFCFVLKRFRVRSNRYSWNDTRGEVICGYFQEPVWTMNGVNSNYIQSFLNCVDGVYKKNSSVIHYRLGDSVWRLKHLDYYKYLDELIRSKKYLVITDSPKILQSKFKDPDIEIRHASLLEDFYTMINAHHLVISPSTLSWWAGMLKADGVVTMPRELFKEIGFTNTKVKIECI